VNDAVNQVAQALGGGTAIGVLVFAGRAIWTAYTKREDLKEREAAAEAQGLDAGFARLVAAAERQDVEIARLSERSIEDRGRIEALEKSNRELADENRTFRTLVGAVIEGLRRKPPDSADTLLDLIFSKAPFLGDPHR